MSSSEVLWLLGNAGTLALVVSRVSGLAWTAPTLATSGLGGRFRLVLAVFLGGILLPLVGPSLAIPVGWPPRGRAGLVAGMVGGGVGWADALVVAGARQAGEIVGMQAGLSPAALFDP